MVGHHARARNERNRPEELEEESTTASEIHRTGVIAHGWSTPPATDGHVHAILRHGKQPLESAAAASRRYGTS